MFEKINKVLILGPHPDDGEFSSGGTINKLIEDGKEVYYAVFSLCEKSVPKEFPSDALKYELLNSCKVLGIKQENIRLYNYEVREFPKYRQEILEELVSLNREIKPDLVFIPSASDIHQDHKTVYEEGIRAFKFCNLLGYEMPWNNFSFSSSLYVVLNENQINKKIESINRYETQKFRSYSSEDFVKSLSKLRGIQIKETYAESFEIIRWIEK